MIIVTGGAGFIGSAIAAELNKRGQNGLLLVDCLGDDDKWKNLRNLKFMDYMERETLLKRVQDDDLPKIESIVHMGACSSTTERDASFLTRNNFEYTKALCQYALKKNARFVYASSAATYGDGGLGYGDDEKLMEKLQPMNPYGLSKQMFDCWALHQGLLGRIAGLKYFNVYGPNEYHKKDMRSMVMKAYEQASQDGKVRLFKSYRPEYSDGEQVRDFLYIRDAVEMTLFLLENKNTNGIYNAGTGRSETWNTLASSVFKALGKPARIEYIDMPESIRGQYQYETRADITKLVKAGYSGSPVNLEHGVADYVKNYLIPEKYL
jgi:ADP-L-glycero-D-manno-heptose 6-epimerase